MKRLDVATTGESHAPIAVTHSGVRPILLNVSLADGTQRTVFVSNVTTQVAHGVLTATGWVNIPGKGRDTFTAVARADDASDTSVALMLEVGSLHREPLCLVTDVSHLLDNQPGAGGRATEYVAMLLTQILAGADP